jgi:predicted SprT family Zn-dependent metalloprotease
LDLHDARQLAESLLHRHGLSDWTFRFDRARRRFGSCRPRSQTITLSAPLTLLNSIDEVRDTVLHEIAHALAPGDGHGQRWRAMCARIGAKPRRCYDDRDGRVVSPPRRQAPYQIGCLACGWWTARYRRLSRRLVCRTCRQPVVLSRAHAVDVVHALTSSA